MIKAKVYNRLLNLLVDTTEGIAWTEDFDENRQTDYLIEYYSIFNINDNDKEQKIVLLQLSRYDLRNYYFLIKHGLAYEISPEALLKVYELSYVNNNMSQKYFI